MAGGIGIRLDISAANGQRNRQRQFLDGLHLVQKAGDGTIQIRIRGNAAKTTQAIYQTQLAGARGQANPTEAELSPLVLAIINFDRFNPADGISQTIEALEPKVNEISLRFTEGRKTGNDAVGIDQFGHTQAGKIDDLLHFSNDVSAFGVALRQGAGAPAARVGASDAKRQLGSI